MALFLTEKVYESEMNVDMTIYVVINRFTVEFDEFIGVNGGSTGEIQHLLLPEG